MAIAKVVSAKTMDDETFTKHFNARHVHEIGLKSVPTRPASYLRAHHRWAHRDGISVDHVHPEGEE